jgi:hypothetical protein
MCRIENASPGLIMNGHHREATFRYDPITRYRIAPHEGVAVGEKKTVVASGDFSAGGASCGP